MTTIPASSAAQTRIIPHAEGETYSVMGDPMRFILSAEQTGGSYAISEIETRPGSGAPPHIHHREEEAFYVLDGSFSVLVDGTEHRVSRGDYVHVPRGAVRGFTNVGDSNGRLLILHVPGAASGFYIGMGKLPFPPKIEDVAALGEKYGIEIVM